MLMGILVTFGTILIMLPYRTYKSGLTGERNVVKNISVKLSSEYSLFNDVMLRDGKRGGNIDHIIIGPRGIFAIETKNNKNKVTANGDIWEGVRDSPSGQAKFHAKRIYEILKNSRISEGIPFVKAVVVFSNGKAQLRIEKE